jgi:hypothetical protein
MKYHSIAVKDNWEGGREGGRGKKIKKQNGCLLSI